MVNVRFLPGLLPTAMPIAKDTDPISARAGASWNAVSTPLLLALSLLMFAGLYD